MVERVYNVPDVSCEHCVRAITSELTKISGVQEVDVNLDTKTVAVKAQPSVTDEQVRAGIEEAGYDIAG